MTEHDLKMKVLKAAYENGWMVFHRPAGVIRGSAGIGYPDLTLARDGEVLWLELKGDGGVMAPGQWQWWTALQPRCHVITPEQWDTGRVGELLA